MVEIKTGGVLSTECLKPCKNNMAHGHNRENPQRASLEAEGEGSKCASFPLCKSASN